MADGILGSHRMQHSKMCGNRALFKPGVSPVTVVAVIM